LVLQGGGSLGAYEAGAYKALYEWLSEKDKKEWRFDIEEIIRIERKNNEQTISDKTFDFSHGTIICSESCDPPNSVRNGIRPRLVAVN
jgi:hypothetical protein